MGTSVFWSLGERDLSGPFIWSNYMFNDEESILFKQHLLDSGVPEDHIIEIALDDRANKGLRDPDVCYQYVKNSIKGNGQ